MGFLGFLTFVLKCFDLLGWPLFALGYPLCASIRAIETNSNYCLRKLVTYWIMFSLISLFELAFVKLIEWVPLWSYIKLGTICCLVLPRFKGAQYCYKTLVHPCLSANLEEVMNRLYKRLEALLEKDNFLSVTERYVSENGTEVLEKLIASKDLLQSKGSRTDTGVEEIKAAAEAEKKEVSPPVKSDCNEDKDDQKDINRVELPERSALVAANWAYCNEFNVAHKDIKKAELPGRNAVVAGNLVEPAETIVVQAEKKTIAVVEVKEVTIAQIPPAAAAAEKVQKEWTCAVCQVTITCEANLNSHLVGMKHRANCEELKSKAVKQTSKTKNSELGKHDSWSGDSEQSICCCNYCMVVCMSEKYFMSHRKGKKHLAKVQESAYYSAGAQTCAHIERCTINSMLSNELSNC